MFVQERESEFVWSVMGLFLKRCSEFVFVVCHERERETPGCMHMVCVEKERGQWQMLHLHGKWTTPPYMSLMNERQSVTFYCVSCGD